MSTIGFSKAAISTPPPLRPHFAFSSSFSTVMSTVALPLEALPKQVMKLLVKMSLFVSQGSHSSVEGDYTKKRKPQFITV